MVGSVGQNEGRTQPPALVKLSVSVGASYEPELTAPSNLVIRLNVEPLDKDSLLTALIWKVTGEQAADVKSKVSTPSQVPLFAEPSSFVIRLNVLALANVLICIAFLCRIAGVVVKFSVSNPALYTPPATPSNFANRLNVELPGIISDCAPLICRFDGCL